MAHAQAPTIKPAGDTVSLKIRALAKGALKFARNQPLGAVSFFIIMTVVIIAIIGDRITPQSPLTTHAFDRFKDPQWTKGYILGADNLGRDNLSRIIVGLRPSMRVALFGVTAGAFIGYILGLVSGYYGSLVDTILQRIVDSILAFPSLVLALALVAVLGTSAWHPSAVLLFGGIIAIGVIFIAIAFAHEKDFRAAMGAFLPVSAIIFILLILIVGLLDNKPFTRYPQLSVEKVMIPILFLLLPQMTRVVRSVVIANRDAEYIQAARAIGATDFRIMFRHIAPQTFAPMMIIVTAGFGQAIIVESSLSYLGLGIPPPNPSLGGMLSGPTLANVEIAPWNAVFPGLILTLIVFSFNLLGDALRDHFDPRLRK